LATDHRFSPVLVERAGDIDLAVRLDPGASRLGAHGGSRNVRRAAMSMDSIPLVRIIFGVLVAIGLYLTYVGWLAKPASPLGKEQLRQVGGKMK
jgi:hypothetical protein